MPEATKPIELETLLASIAEASNITKAGVFLTACHLAVADKQRDGLSSDICTDIACNSLLLYRQIVAIELLEGILSSIKESRLPPDFVLKGAISRLKEKYSKTHLHTNNLMELLK